MTRGQHARGKLRAGNVASQCCLGVKSFDLPACRMSLLGHCFQVHLSSDQ